MDVPQYQILDISIHALLAESDNTFFNTFLAIFEFLSTLSLRRATTFLLPLVLISLFLSTLSLRRATRLGLLGWLRVLISIHALLAESDVVDTLKFAGPVLFLSTLSLRRATRRHRSNDGSPIHFYPRSPCGERHHGLPGHRRR